MILWKLIVAIILILPFLELILLYKKQLMIISIVLFITVMVIRIYNVGKGEELWE